MSYAIIRNEKYTKDQMIKLAPHNERVKQEYSNKNIDKSKSCLNYHLKKPMHANYFKEFKRMKEDNNLKGQLHKNSIYACEMVITSDKEFFDKIGEKETKRYFQVAYEFVKNYKNLGDENIISAVVHMDEETPHMHLTFIPVVDSKDKEGNSIRKIGGYDFWKEKNSYMILQDSFYEYVRMNGFDLERGKNINNVPHYKIDKLKELTNFYDSKHIKEKLGDEKYDRGIYTSIKSFLNYEEFSPESVDKNLLQPLLHELNRIDNRNKELSMEILNIKKAIDEYSELKDENKNLKNEIKSKQKEIDVYMNLIVKLNDEKESIVEKFRILGIDIENLKEQN